MSQLIKKSLTIPLPGRRKVVSQVQADILSIGLSLILPRSLRQRLREDEPEVFPMPKGYSDEDLKLAANMVNCKDWAYLDRLL